MLLYSPIVSTFLSGFPLIAVNFYKEKQEHQRPSVKYEGAGKSVFSLSEEFTNKTMGIYFLFFFGVFCLFVSLFFFFFFILMILRLEIEMTFLIGTL